jgi:quinol monooxygenase YgiN
MTEKIVVTGTFTVEPGDRDAFIEAAKAGMVKSRAEDGCEEYVLAPDPLDPARVVLSEKWRDQAALDAHIAAMSGGGGGPKPTSVSIDIHTVASTKKMA